VLPAHGELPVPGQQAGIIDAELAGHGQGHRGRNGGRVGQERADGPDRHELDGESQPGHITRTAAGDADVSVAQVAEPPHPVPIDCLGEAPVAGVVGRLHDDGHTASHLTDRHPDRNGILSGIFLPMDGLTRGVASGQEPRTGRYHRNQRRLAISAAPPTAERGLEGLISDFLTDLANANRSATTQRAYGADLAAFARFYGGPATGVTTEVLRGFLSTRAHLAPATRARTQAALSSFLGWAYRHDLIDANPMGRIERVKLDAPAPRGLPRTQIEAILACIPATKKRDRLLFRLLAETGLRPGELLGLHVEDLDLTPDDEHLSVLGKGGRRRTVLLDDGRLVKDLRSYLKRTGYRHGPLFRAEKNGRGGPLRYQSIQERWVRYCASAGVTCTLHQLRHSHATELVNDGVSLATIRKRLGHKNLQTTLRYAEQSDAAADAELRSWRRRRGS
jgi:integrase/recombinase XerD